mmetsp:Transcript_71235/g.204330  ORF Transcript_71235/g.204330 Transcript_71235/m.204330 type:complete len:206 (+) Transcript_71235:1220-1837(+)
MAALLALPRQARAGFSVYREAGDGVLDLGPGPLRDHRRHALRLEPLPPRRLPVPASGADVNCGGHLQVCGRGSPQLGAERRQRGRGRPGGLGGGGAEGCQAQEEKQTVDKPGHCRSSRRTGGNGQAAAQPQCDVLVQAKPAEPRLWRRGLAGGRVGARRPSSGLLDRGLGLQAIPLLLRARHHTPPPLCRNYRRWRRRLRRQRWR